ncbi:FMRF-Like Peptide [Caenorhabditis elegans]|uniref:FMRF-Like Peptide n=1 Tax=Caenorhabditis elegans TaxID=6239 RepID=Q95ZU4_CAEEL|nr:FMRF-Like Peptide [Caenorhabditis elegans]CAC42293.1 FMRF-Like Peptide [Caenorhabditis elegans]|eukprot:NP_506312.1 Uncharacterized protein CELE_F32H5.3 [Caenorhabditis elegans]
MVSITYILLISTVTVLTVSAAPIVTEQKDIAEFSNSNKDANVFLPFRELPERLIDDFNSKELDEGRDLPSESDIFYFFGKTPVLTEVIDARKRGGF